MSQTEWVLQRLQEGGEPLTPAEALRNGGIMRLAARVHDLRRQGHDIRCQRLTVHTAAGAIAYVAGYTLRRPYRAAAAEEVACLARP